MTETNATSIPTAQELDEWREALRHGYGIPGAMDRFEEGYRRLLVVAEKALACVKRDADECHAILFQNYYDSIPTLEALEDALKALDAPVEGK